MFASLGGKKHFSIRCNAGDGQYPDDIEWPDCVDSPEETETTKKPCRCVGDLSVQASKTILDKFCRNTDIKGNYQILDGQVPPSKKRCGTTNPENPTLDDHCFCTDLMTMPEASFWVTISLNQVPWQWETNPKTKTNNLIDPTTKPYKDLKATIEKTVRHY